MMHMILSLSGAARQGFRVIVGTVTGMSLMVLPRANRADSSSLTRRPARRRRHWHRGQIRTY
jgi:hypothetical protein